MENLTLSQTDPTCSSCFNAVSEHDVFCTNCGYPVKGTSEEQTAFEIKQTTNSIDIWAYNKELKNASNSLYFLGGVFLFWGVVTFFIKRDDPDVLAYTIPNLILSVLFLALGGYSNKKPFACLVSGLVLYIIVQILLAIDNPMNIVSGIIVKIFIVGYLIKGIKSTLNIERLKKENNIA